MARVKNPNTPEDGKALATQVTEDAAAKFRILAMVSGQTVGDLLRTLVEAHLDANPVEIKVAGQVLGAE